MRIDRPDVRVVGSGKKQCGLSHAKGGRVSGREAGHNNASGRDPAKAGKRKEDIRKLDEKGVLLEAPHKGSQIAIRVLEQTAHGIYVCVDAQGLNRHNGRFQRMRLLERKNASELLQGRESWKEIDGCPAIGGLDTDSQY
jgi:hypothetical protein